MKNLTEIIFAAGKNASSNINCPLKKGRDAKKIESHGNRVILGLTTNQKTHGDTMGRRKLTLGKHCKGSHFSWGERLKLQYYYAGSNGYRKERSPTVQTPKR